MTTFQPLADKALHDEPLTREECLSVLQAPDEQLLDLLHAAFRVRSRYFGTTVRLQMLQNAKSGACQEDCHYCSQSAVSTAPIERYNLLPQSTMVEGARQAAASKAQRYCIVISGRSPLDREIDEIAGAVRDVVDRGAGRRRRPRETPRGQRAARESGRDRVADVLLRAHHGRLQTGNARHHGANASASMIFLKVAGHALFEISGFAHVQNGSRGIKVAVHTR